MRGGDVCAVAGRTRVARLRKKVDCVSIQTLVVTSPDAGIVAELVALLLHAGYRHITASVSGDPCAAIRDILPDLVLLDMHAPHLDASWRTLDLLRADPALRPIPVLICMAEQYVTAATIDMVQALNCLIILKPVTEAGVLTRVQTAIGPPPTQVLVPA